MCVCVCVQVVGRCTYIVCLCVDPSSPQKADCFPHEMNSADTKTYALGHMQLDQFLQEV